GRAGRRYKLHRGLRTAGHQEMAADLPVPGTRSALSSWTAVFLLCCTLCWLLRSFALAFLRYKVSSISWSFSWCPTLSNAKRDAAFGKQHVCLPPPELPYRWPLGADRIRDLWTSNAEGRLLPFLCSIAKNYEPRNMLSQYLLFGPRAFHIL